MTIAQPVTPAPSGRYGFYSPDPLPGADDPDAVLVQVAERLSGAWHPTPARYGAATVAVMTPNGWPLYIDRSQDWRLSNGDTDALIGYARALLRERHPAQCEECDGADDVATYGGGLLCRRCRALMTLVHRR